MVNIEKIGLTDLERIIDLANKTWEPTYKNILSKEQLLYMFDLMYNKDTLKERVLTGNEFYIARINKLDIGFMETVNNHSDKLSVSKIYIDPNFQKKGIGKIMIEFLEKEARTNKFKSLSLNVNRFNPAQHFYTKMGFHIEKEIDIEIGNGYLMEDYIMKKELSDNQ